MLSGTAIRRLTTEGKLRFAGKVRGNGLLLTLGTELLPFSEGTLVDPRERASVWSAYGPQRSWDVYDLSSRQSVLIAAAEHLALPTTIGGSIGTLSHVARLGLFSHCASPFVGPGFNGHLTLELFNASPHVVRLRPGLPVAKVILFETTGEDPVEGYGAIPLFYNSTVGERIDLRSRIHEEFGDDE